MSYTKGIVYPCNPQTTRGQSNKISCHGDKIAYANGKTIIIRDINNPKLAVPYCNHVHPTTVARISPSGYYCASADASGSVRVWDLVGGDQVLKGEFKALAGRINDLEWDGESKRIIAVGEGRDTFGSVFMVDTGSSAGEVSGHSKAINAVSIRRQRPFRAVTAGDDGSIIFLQGTPYKYLKTLRTHSQFVHDIRFSSNGDLMASVGADSKAFLYDGKTGDSLGELENAHSGSIMGVTWSPDSLSFATSSADRTVKLWDAETRKVKSTWTIGPDIEHQQVGNTWSAQNGIVSLSTSGDLSIIDPRGSEHAIRTLHGPQRTVTALAPSGAETFSVGCADGRILAYSEDQATPVRGSGHSSFVSGIIQAGASLISVGYDDKVRISEQNAFLDGVATSTASQPKAIAALSDGTAFVAEAKQLEVIRSNQVVTSFSLTFDPHSLSVFDKTLAIGGDDHRVHLYDWNGNKLQEISVLEGCKGVVSALAFAPNGELLAAGDSSGKIKVFSLREKKSVIDRWVYHSARITSLAWTSDSRHCASGSLDTHVYIWSVPKPLKNIAVKNAAPGGVNSVSFTKDDAKEASLISAGADSCIRSWQVKFHAYA